MQSVILSLLFGCAAGTVGTGLGGAISLCVKRTDSRMLARLMGFSAGMMLAVALFSMIPEALPLSGAGATALGAALGAGFIALAGRLMLRGRSDSRMTGLGLLLFCGIALHNIPEGIAVGAGFQSEGSFGPAMALIILLHNIPEGLAIALPLRAAGKNVLLWTAAAGLPTLLGTGIGIAAGRISPEFLGSSIAFAAGAMTYLTILELIPESIRLSDKIQTLIFAALGLALGVLLVLVIL